MSRSLPPVPDRGERTATIPVSALPQVRLSAATSKASVEPFVDIHFTSYSEHISRRVGVQFAL